MWRVVPRLALTATAAFLVFDGAGLSDDVRLTLALVLGVVLLLDVLDLLPSTSGSAA